MTTNEIKEIVRSEVKKALKDELANHLKSSIKNGDLKKETNNLIKNAFEAMYKFLWNRKSVWASEIGK